MNGEVFVQPPDPWFEPDGRPESAAPLPENEPTNVCRAALLSAALGGPAPLTGLDEEIAALGANRDRLSDLTPPDDRDRPALVVEALGRLVEIDESGRRVQTWAEIAEQPSVVPAYAFLLDLLRSDLPRESAAAATAVTLEFGPAWEADTDPFAALDLLPVLGPVFVANNTSWSTLFAPLLATLVAELAPDRALALVAWLRLEQSLRSPDPVVRELASATQLALGDEAGDEDGEGDLEGDPAPDEDGAPDDDDEEGGAPPIPATSILVHGTKGWIGSWWRPRGNDFHPYVQAFQPNLYGGGGEFAWSGALSRRHRREAALDLAGWVRALAPGGLVQAYAHSYGGEVAARAWNNGVTIETLVLLSVPVTQHVQDAVDAGADVIDIRLAKDPVLALARLQQRLSQRIQPVSNVREVILGKRPRWKLSHSSTHMGVVWDAKNIRSRAGL